MNSEVSRREFLALAGVLIQAALLPLPAGAIAKSNAPVDLHFLSKEVGEAYLQRYPQERDLPRLRATLHFLGQASEVEIKSKLVADIHRDFGQQDLFHYRGWVLSRTEGRLCAYKHIVGT